jgi:hypothetical protein
MQGRGNQRSNNRCNWPQVQIDICNQAWARQKTEFRNSVQQYNADWGVRKPLSLHITSLSEPAAQISKQD